MNRMVCMHQVPARSRLLVAIRRSFWVYVGFAKEAFGRRSTIGYVRSGEIE